MSSRNPGHADREPVSVLFYAVAGTRVRCDRATFCRGSQTTHNCVDILLPVWFLIAAPSNGASGRGGARLNRSFAPRGHGRRVGCLLGLEGHEVSFARSMCAATCAARQQSQLQPNDPLVRGPTMCLSTPIYRNNTSAQILDQDTTRDIALQRGEADAAACAESEWFRGQGLQDRYPRVHGLLNMGLAPEPDARLVEYLIGSIQRIWIPFVHQCPESELDGVLVDCSVLTDNSEPNPPISPDVLTVNSYTIDGERDSRDVWMVIGACPKGSMVQVEASACGITCWLLCSLVKNRTFQCDCVFKDPHGRPGLTSDRVFEDRVREWCNALVAVGAALGASRVEIEDKIDPEADPALFEEFGNGPLVLWRS